MDGSGDETGDNMSLELTKLNKDDKSIASVSTSTTMNTNIRNPHTTRQRMILLLMMMVCIMVFTISTFPGVSDYYTHSHGKVAAKTDELITKPLKPRKDKVSGQEHYYMLPKAPYQKPVGVLVVLHSCKRSGLEFFHLPEDRIIALDALQKGLAVLSVTSQDRESGCFTQKDLTRVNQVVEEWTILHGLDKLPRFGLAASSGASFLFFVYKKLKLISMVVYNTPQSFLPDDLNDEAMIPTAYVTMPADKALSRQVRKNYEELFRAGVAAQHFQVSPRPFTRELCASRIPELDSKYCNSMFDILHKDHPQLLDTDGFVAKDWQKGEDWQAFFDAVGLNMHIAPGMPYLTTHAFSGHSWTYAVVKQEVRTCQAYHGMSSEHHAKVLDFLLAQSESNSENG